jgi:predicted lipase
MSYAIVDFPDDSSIFIDRFSYCKQPDISRFSCPDCTSSKTLIGSYDPASPASSQVVVVLDNTEEEILVGFRGTTNTIPQWLSDLNAVYTKWGKNGKVHAGFYNRFSEIKSNTMTFINKALKKIPDADIVISGHSLGSCVSILFATYLKEIGFKNQIYIYTYGSPRVGDLTFAKYVDKLFGDNLLRIMNELDAVTDVPPRLMGYRHTGKMIVCQTGTSNCKEGKRLDENTGGVLMVLKRSVATIKNVKLCHLTYMNKQIGSKGYTC